MPSHPWIQRGLAGPALALLAGAADAGGHLDVDDAGTVGPGQCQYEAWYGRLGIEPIRDIHFGPACRVGPFEITLNIDRYAVQGRRLWLLGPQIKWTFLGDDESTWSAALSATASFDTTFGGHPGGQFLIPVTWHPHPKLWLHFNAGSDWLTGEGNRRKRIGAGVEWAINEQISLLGERFKAFGVWNSRIGVRYNITPLMSLDLTAARVGPQGVRGFIIGINHEFGRP